MVWLYISQLSSGERRRIFVPYLLIGILPVTEPASGGCGETGASYVGIRQIPITVQFFLEVYHILYIYTGNPCDIRIQIRVHI
jgi:hypothetical protein